MGALLSEPSAGSFTILFNGQFYIGLYERQDGAGYSVAQIIFGPEPTDQEVYEFILQRIGELQFSAPSGAADAMGIIAPRKINHHRAQREARRALERADLSYMTKAQQALAAEQELHKKERQVESRAQRQAEQQRKFELRQAKRAQKQRGR